MQTERGRFRAVGSRALGLVLLAAVLAVASGRAGTAVAQEEDDPFATRVRFLHAAPDLGQIEVAINFDERLDEYDYGDTSEFLDVEPGLVRLTISEDRAGFNYYVFDAVYPIAAGNDYNVVISDGLVIGSVVDLSPVREGNARVQIVHASVDAPPVDVAVTGGDVLVEDLRFGERSAEVEVPAGTYDLEIRLSETGDVALEIPGVVVEAGQVYEFVAMGDPTSEDTPLTVTPLISTARTGDEATPAAEEATPAG